MGLVPQFTKADIDAAIKKKLKAYQNAVLVRLKQAGEKFVNLARDHGDYTDQSGNLRSSVGYIILHNGVPLVEDFKQVKQGVEGVNKGHVLAKKEALKNGYVLVGVAGMDYAAAVESKGRDVITGSAQIVESWLKNALKTLDSKL